jgi:hypothetical protein
MIDFHGCKFALRIDDNGLVLLTLDSRGEPEAKILTVLHNGKIGLAENIHPDMVPFVRLDDKGSVQIDGQATATSI